VSLKVVDDVEQEVLMRQGHEREEQLVKKIRQYESGEEGRLSSIFPGTLRHWLDHCYSLGIKASVV